MKYLLAVISLAAAAAAHMKMNTPDSAYAAVQCDVYQITWTGGQAPFDIRLLDAAQNTVEVAASGADGSPFPWTVNQPSGQSFALSIRDAVGDSGVSGLFTIQPSSDSSCLTNADPGHRR